MLVSKSRDQRPMYLIDTNVVSEARKAARGNLGVVNFFATALTTNVRVYLSSITIGELRRGVELVRYRGDLDRFRILDHWLGLVLEAYSDNIIAFDRECAQVWGRLRVPHPENEIDKQIAATALVNDLTVVTRNTADFEPTGVRLLNPFTPTIAR